MSVSSQKHSTDTVAPFFPTLKDFEVSVNAVSSNNSAVVSIVKLLTSAIVLVPIFITPELPVCVAFVIYPYLFLF